MISQIQLNMSLAMIICKHNYGSCRFCTFVEVYDVLLVTKALILNKSHVAQRSPATIERMWIAAIGIRLL